MKTQEIFRLTPGGLLGTKNKKCTIGPLKGGKYNELIVLMGTLRNNTKRTLVVSVE